MMGIPYVLMGGFGAMLWIQFRRRRKQDRDYLSAEWPGVEPEGL
jgi:hypothetical protein